MTINVANSLFSESFTVEIEAASSILNLATYNASKIVLFLDNYEFMVQYESLGLPSCALVEMNSPNIRYTQEVC